MRAHPTPSKTDDTAGDRRPLIRRDILSERIHPDLRSRLLSSLPGCNGSTAPSATETPPPPEARMSDFILAAEPKTRRQ
jgi:hypothetical protein